MHHINGHRVSLPMSIFIESSRWTYNFLTSLHISADQAGVCAHADHPGLLLLEDSVAQGVGMGQHKFIGHAEYILSTAWGVEARGVVVLCDIFRTGAQEHKSAGYSEMVCYQIIKK